MEWVYLSLGSNIEPHKNIQLALNLLKVEFGELTLSTVYQSRSVGFDGADFLNLVVQIETDMPIGKVNAILHFIEDASGRNRLNGKSFDSRTLDIDILLYGDLQGEHDGVQLPRLEILEHAHVLLPLSELVPDKEHPVTGTSYAELWQQFMDTTQQLTEVTLLAN